MGASLCPCFDLYVPPIEPPPARAASKTPPRQTNSVAVAPGTPSFRFAGNSSSQEEAFKRKYELGQVIGKGSTSEVKKCRDRRTGAEYACKIIDKSKIKNKFSPLLEQFENEIEVLMRLQQVKQHPNIIRLEDVFITDTTIFMIMELMKGGELFDYVVTRQYLSEAEASSIIRKVTSAVSLMHSQNIIHRDLKPENLLLTHTGPGAEVKIIDFGLSKMLPDPSNVAQSFLGTRGYLAPEMLQRRSYSASVDVWALGVISFILLCGCLPFDDSAARINDETARAKFQLRFPSWAKDLSVEAKDFLAKLLNPDPYKRINVHDALEHPWLQERILPEAKKKLLQSPKHIKDIRDRIGGNGGGGIGAAVGAKKQGAEAPF